MARKRTPPLPLARLSGLGQPKPGQAPAARLTPFSWEFFRGANLGAKKTRKVVNSVVFIVPDRGSRRIALSGLLPVPPISLAKSRVPLNTLVALSNVILVNPPPLSPAPVLLYTKTMGAAPTEIVVELGTLRR